MKSKLIISVLLLLTSMVCIAQTEEEMKKMMDSLMGNVPADQRQFVEQMMQKGKEADAQRKAEKERARKQQESKNRTAQKKNEDEFYWRNRMATNTQGKFENWPHGAVEIRTMYWGRDRKENEIAIGNISANGQVLINFPKIDRLTVKPMNSNQHESERVVGNNYLNLDYSDKNVGYFSTRHNVNVYKGGERIGFIDIGNAIKPVVNLNAPCCFDKAGNGYTAYWVYVDRANSITGIKHIDGTPGNEGKISCDLKLQPGWNLIIERVEGTKEKPSSGIPGPRYWKNQYYTATTIMPDDAKYYFTSNR